MNFPVRSLPFSFFSLLLPVLFVLDADLVSAQSNDSVIVVQAFAFEDDPTLHAWGNIYEYDDMVDFPEPGSYEKILMYYTLKCDARTRADNYLCGEWDYSTWTRVWDDSTTHWEIGRFITPYGINLSLGPDGVTWVFDVTDYAPVLTGRKRVTAGNSQELLDLRFHFIKGTPPRTPLSVTRLWNPGSHSYEKIVQDSLLEPIQVTLDPSASMYRIHTRPQGGNFNGGANTDNCAEFCNREHWLTINGEERFRWNVWKECGNIPVYPQGGTWPIDRAGWCPGEIVETQAHELTPFVTPGETVTIDYGIENPPQFVPYGHWVFWADLVAYGPPNFTTDASVEGIIAPSNDDIQSRVNPICSSPIVRIRNSGSETMTSVTFEYGIAGGETFTYTWNGSLDFLEEGIVQLPPIPVDEWESEGQTFHVRLKNPNGKGDEYARNDYAESRFDVPERAPESFEIRITTNNLTAFSGASYEWELLDADGNAVQRHTNLQSNTTLTYPVNLPEGCYTFRFVNPIGLGLDFWFYRDQLGTGGIQFRANGTTFKEFAPDFGNEILYQFRVPAPRMMVDEGTSDTIRFAPTAVGSQRTKTIRIRPGNGAGLDVKQLTFFTGRSNFNIAETRPELPADTSVSLGDEEVLEVDVVFTPTSHKEFTGRMLVTSNDFEGTRSLYFVGSGDTTLSVKEPATRKAPIAELRAVPTTISDVGRVIFRVNRETEGEAVLELVDIRGRVVRTLYRDRARAAEEQVEMRAEGLSSGTYYLLLRVGGESVVSEVKIVR